MAPALRSSNSTQNTPTRTTRSTSSHAGTPNIASTPNATPRKTPTCTKCGRPKAGHPRSGCPFVDSPSPHVADGTDKDDDNGDLVPIAVRTPVKKQAESPQQLTSALKSLRLRSATPTRGSPGKLKEGLDGQVTLPAGDFVDEKVAKVTKIVRWQDLVSATESVTERRTLSPRVQMPGTLIAPSPSTSFTSEDSFSDSHNISIKTDSHLSYVSSSVASSPSIASSASSVTSTQSLGRTMSMEERSLFLDRVHDRANATLYTLPTADVPEIVSSANSLGLISRVIDIPSRQKDGKKVNGCGGYDEDEESWLILGRTERAVQRLYENVQQDLQARMEQAKPRRVGPIGAAAGGMVVGAVAAVTGLAFS